MNLQRVCLSLETNFNHNTILLPQGVHPSFGGLEEDWILDL